MAYTYTDFLKKAAASNTLKDFDPDELRLAQPNPDYGIAAASLKAEANTASTSAQRALANQAADQLAASYRAASYNGFTGSKQEEIDNVLGQIGSFPDFSYDQQAPWMSRMIMVLLFSGWRTQPEMVTASPFWKWSAQWTPAAWMVLAWASCS